MFEVNVAPDMAMYSLLRNQGYDPAYALAEFVDNAVHAYQVHCKQRQKKGDPLRLTLKVYSADYHDATLRNSITIEDDGPGISRERLPDALKPARGHGGRGLSEFGIGMKAAAVWFSDAWRLATIPVGEAKRYDFAFDLDDLLDSGKDTLKVHEHTAKQGSPSGTTITLSNLRQILDTHKYKHVCDLLRELYQRFTAGDSPRLVLTAYLNETPHALQYLPPARKVLFAPVHRLVGKVTYAIGEDRTWTVPISMDFQGRRITGHISLLETGSYKDNPGLVLYRNERVIVGTTKKPYLPQTLFGTSNKYARQRVFGELHMDGLPVTYTKDGFLIDEQAFVQQLRADPNVAALIKQAESYRTDNDKVTKVADEAAFEAVTKGKSSPASKSKDPTKTDGNVGSGKENPAEAPGSQNSPPGTGAPPVPGPERPSKKPQDGPFVSTLKRLHDTASSHGLKTIINEALYQYNWRRDVAAALCLRIVVELGVLERLRRDFSVHYARVADQGIKKVLNYLHTNGNGVFDTKLDHRVIKCVQSAVGGQQMAIILLNNIAHGSYQPTHSELDKFVTTLEPLLLWAYT
ncbi:hypothetical protein GCM10008098_30050 [Rhodanobacter panaciterrae]|uniref:ATP-binding protein n=1 Tax=Rhodanobacter panaciterrae TaxID=490572 RepID=A0ABQ3A793_9GAMM|nr:ATP-binding protein [Rhodanobacter panaciterrae]GGY34821.1 hypothetical protein GCM10008098_30050 [Rhodanobacter panaciterrae]